LDRDNGNFDITNSRYVSSSVFTTPPPGSLGNESRTDSVLRGWASYNESLSLYKDFTFKEVVTWRIGGNGANVFNRHQWCDPNTNLSDGDNFGQVQGQCNLPRAFQIYMKLNF
jgi:hypothetical protein